MSLGRLLRTVCSLRADQVLWRLRYSLERRWGGEGRRWNWHRDAPPPLANDMPRLPSGAFPEADDAEVASSLAEGRFEHLGRGVRVGKERPDWHLGARHAERLWIVTLHYHGWAEALARAVATGGEAGSQAVTLFRHYVADWIERCSLGRSGSRELAWNPYAVATRIGHWVRSVQVAGDELFASDEKFYDRFLASLWKQAAFLSDHLEWDLRANHLLRDIVGLAMAGRFFAGGDARRWLRRADRVARQQMEEQILADGGHFERSAKYHLEAMDDLHHLALLSRDERVSRKLRTAWSAASEWAAWMRHPDGDVVLLNDGGLVGSTTVERLLGRGTSIDAEVDLSPRRGGRLFSETGIAVWHGDPWSVFFDCAAPGPEVQPGHGHADNLTLECSYGGRRLVVDPGNYGYDDDSRRRYDRGTKSHNTLCIDDTDSSEVWSVFRLGRRARPVGLEATVGADSMAIRCGHDGYRHLPGRPLHWRLLEVGERRSLSLVDRVEGRGEHGITGGLLLAPGWRAEVRPGGWHLTRGALRLAVDLEGPPGLRLGIEERPYHPSYGVEEQAIRLSWHWRGQLPFRVETYLRPL